MLGLTACHPHPMSLGLQAVLLLALPDRLRW
jgi:hypothetical protein